MRIQHLAGITSRVIATPRLRIHALFSGAEGATPVVFVHGNLSSSTFWEEIMLRLPSQYRAIAPDLRGYGETEDKPIDATRGYGDWVEDLQALTQALGIGRYHVVGHSLGGGVVFSLVAAAPASPLSVTLVAPAPPYGYGGTKDADGTPCFSDFAGSGAGTVNVAFVRRVAAQDRSATEPATSPRMVMKTFYWNPRFQPHREEELLSALLMTKCGPGLYPGDVARSANWPWVAPGRLGPANALSPKYVGTTVTRFVAAVPKPPILWVQGAVDEIVSEHSLSDVGTLGQAGVIPGWPGPQVYPPQPMVSQTRAVLARYAAQGGSFQEQIIAEAGHTPYLEKPDEFLDHLLEHLTRADARANR